MSDNGVTTMPDPRPTLLSYADARVALGRHPLRSRDVPVEHELSLPVPSTRWGGPAYAVFAGAATRRPGTPKQLAVPDRWWAVDARSGALIAYSATAAVPFTDADLGGPTSVASSGQPVRTVLNKQELLGELMDQVVPGFLDPALPLAAHLIGDLRNLWRELTPEGAAGWYRALAPDFFGWLESGGRRR
jgi:hypothetical protein